MEMFGPETDDWVDRRITVFRRRMVRKSADGEMRERHEKAVECVDPHVREPRATAPRKDVEELTAADISWEDGR